MRMFQPFSVACVTFLYTCKYYKDIFVRFLPPFHPNLCIFLFSSYFSARMYFPLCCVSSFLKSFIFFMEFCVKKPTFNSCNFNASTHLDNLSNKFFYLNSPLPPSLTERLDGVLLRLLLLAGLPAGHQGGYGERVRPGWELRLRGGRVLHDGAKARARKYSPLNEKKEKRKILQKSSTPPVFSSQWRKKGKKKAHGQIRTVCPGLRSLRALCSLGRMNSRLFGYTCRLVRLVGRMLEDRLPLTLSCGCQIWGRLAVWEASVRFTLPL